MNDKPSKVAHTDSTASSAHTALGDVDEYGVDRARERRFLLVFAIVIGIGMLIFGMALVTAIVIDSKYRTEEASPRIVFEKPAPDPAELRRPDRLK